MASKPETETQGEMHRRVTLGLTSLTSRAGADDVVVGAGHAHLPHAVAVPAELAHHVTPGRRCLEARHDLARRCFVCQLQFL